MQRQRRNNFISKEPRVIPISDIDFIGLDIEIKEKRWNEQRKAMLSDYILYKSVILIFFGN